MRRLIVNYSYSVFYFRYPYLSLYVVLLGALSISHILLAIFALSIIATPRYRFLCRYFLLVFEVYAEIHSRYFAIGRITCFPNTININFLNIHPSPHISRCLVVSKVTHISWYNSIVSFSVFRTYFPFYYMNVCATPPSSRLRYFSFPRYRLDSYFQIPLIIHTPLLLYFLIPIFPILLFWPILLFLKFSTVLSFRGDVFRGRTRH